MLATPVETVNDVSLSAARFATASESRTPRGLTLMHRSVGSIAEAIVIVKTDAAGPATVQSRIPLAAGETTAPATLTEPAMWMLSGRVWCIVVSSYARNVVGALDASCAAS